MSKYEAGDIAWLMIEDEDGRLQAFERVRIDRPCPFPSGDWMIEQLRPLAYCELPKHRAWDRELCSGEELPRMIETAGMTSAEIGAGVPA